MNPKVAIIISNYNYGAYVLEAINSALKQTYNNIQIYVLDDGSSDDSWKKICEQTDPVASDTIDTPYYK